MGKLKITQKRSLIGCNKKQIANVRALGLKRIRHSVEKADSIEIRGMITKVKHLITVEEI